MAENIWQIKPLEVVQPQPPVSSSDPEILVPISTAFNADRLKFKGLGVKTLDINPQLKEHMNGNVMIYNWVMTAVSIAAHSAIADPEAVLDGVAYPSQERIETELPIPENFRESLGALPGQVIVVHRSANGVFKVMT